MCVTGALVGGTVASSLIGANSASNAADAQAKAAQDANETQRYIYDSNVELSEPWRGAGENALAAMMYDMGLGPQPTFGGTTLQVQEVPGTPGQTVTSPGYGFGVPGVGIEYPTGTTTTPGTPTQYRVGDQMFATREEAQAYADANSTPGTPYEGFTTSPGYEFRLEQGQRGIDNSAAARGMRLSGATMKDQERFAQGIAADEYANHYNRLAGIAGVGQTATQSQMAAGQNYANAYGANQMAAGNARASGYMGQNDAIQGGMNNLFGIYGMSQAGMMGQPATTGPLVMY